jgi:hypothetical protein
VRHSNAFVLESGLLDKRAVSRSTRSLRSGAAPAVRSLDQGETHWCCSSVLNEADVFSLLAESLSAEIQLVLADEAEVTAGDSASAGVLAVVSWVGSKLVWHLRFAVKL